MSNTQKEMKEFTVTMDSGTKFGGKFRNSAAAAKAHDWMKSKVVKVEQKALFTSEEAEELQREKLEHMSR
jgi:tetrahydromethanopterin S-methyltransferase subunit H